MRYSTNRTGSRVATSSYSTKRATRGDNVKRVKYTFDPLNEYEILNQEDHYELYGRRRRRQQLEKYSQRISTREHLRRGSTFPTRNESLDHQEIVENLNFDSARLSRISSRDHKPSTSESTEATVDLDGRSRSNSKRNAHEETSNDDEDIQDEQDCDSTIQSVNSISDHESENMLDGKLSILKNVRFSSNVNIKRPVGDQSDVTVTDPEDSDEIMNYGRDAGVGLKTRKDETRDVIIGGKALRVTKARRKYTEEYSDYEEDYRSVQYQPRLRQRQPINYSKQLAPANFTQILEHESKLLDGIMDASERFKDEEKSRGEIFSSKRRKSGLPTKYAKSPRRHERLNESDDEELPALKNGRIFGLLQASSMMNAKNQILPVNMKEMMQAEEIRLLKKVDDESKNKFLDRKDGIDAESNQSISKIGFEDVSGFDDHIMSLKEMVGLPLMYPDIFSKFSINPPKGVLFHGQFSFIYLRTGPPGTGKTMMARALANSCSTTGRPVAFFMRKGADILSKWVGESERQLRLLFEQAKAWQPSIIFFDEIDGLAPVRSSKQDQIHASVVSTLLSLMDGLDKRGQVVVIGATNRIDSIDPALRRPGRFDREFFFGLPKESARRKIIQLATKDWIPPFKKEDFDCLALMTRGYNGADVKALCTEAALHAVRRTFPQIYNGTDKYCIDLNKIQVTLNDFLEILTKLAPSTERSSLSFGRSLPQHLAPLIQNSYAKLSTWIKRMIPILKQTQRIKPAPSFEDSSEVTNTGNGTGLWIQDYLKSFSPMLLIYGPCLMGQDLLGSALVEILEQNSFYVRSIDIGSLISVDVSLESIILTAFCELKRHKQAALYLPNLHTWWNTVSDAAKEIFLSLLEQTRHASLMVLINMEWELSEIPSEISAFFPNLESNDPGCRKIGDWKYAYYLSAPDESCRESFFTHLLEDFIRQEMSPVNSKPSCSFASSVAIDERVESINQLFDADQLQDLMKEYEIHKRKFRQVFAAILDELRKSYRTFTKVLENNVFPDYQPVEHMDLMIMEDRVHANNYELPQDFMKDINLICANVLQGSNARSTNHRDTIAKVRKLVDSAQEHIQLLTSEFIQQCWYFFLFKRSGVLPSQVEESGDKKDEDDQIDIMSITSEKDPLLELEILTEEEKSTVKKLKMSDLDESSCFESTIQENHKDMKKDHLNSFDAELLVEENHDMFDEPIQPQSIPQDRALDLASPVKSQIEAILPQSSSFLDISKELNQEMKSDFVKYASLKTSGYALFELEDLAVALAASCLDNGKLDLSSMKSLLDKNI